MNTDNSTKLQDCNVVTQAFERGANFNTDEASVFATKTRTLQNTKMFSKIAQNSLQSYQQQSSLALAQQKNTPDAASLSGMKIQNQYITVPSGDSSSILSKAVKDCIPCAFRLIHNIDLNMGANLLTALKADLKNRLGILDDLKNLLSNIDIYGDFCQMASFLNFMCVPDLQRMLVILASMLSDFSSALCTVSGMLQALLAPFFTPVLLSINALLDQLVQLVLSPLTCIINSIELNITKLDVGALMGDTTLTSAKTKISKTGSTVSQSVRQIQSTTRSALFELHTMLNQGNTLIRQKLAFYTNELTKLLGQWGAHDTQGLQLSNRKIINLRLIGLIRSMIQIKSKGGKLCDENKTPSSTELDNFFSTYVSPNSPFNLSVDNNGNLVLAPKTSPTPAANSVNIDGQPLLTPPTETRIIKCALSTTGTDVDIVNAWIQQLNAAA